MPYHGNVTSYVSSLFQLARLRNKKKTMMMFILLNLHETSMLSRETLSQRWIKYLSVTIRLNCLEDEEFLFFFGLSINILNILRSLVMVTIKNILIYFCHCRNLTNVN